MNDLLLILVIFLAVGGILILLWRLFLIASGLFLIGFVSFLIFVEVYGIYLFFTEPSLYFDDIRTPCIKVNVECSYINYGFNNLSPRYIAPNQLYLDVDIVY